MKWLIIILFLLGPKAYTQSLKEKLQGDWVNVLITDSVGQQAAGELGSSADYLKFSFKGSKLFIAQAPFDVGAVTWLAFGDNYFELIGMAMAQSRYTVVSLNESELMLRTVSHKGKTINYHFHNQQNYARHLDQLSHFRDFGQIIVRFTYLKETKMLFQNTVYQIDNSVLNRVPGPRFISGEFPTFSNYLDFKFRLPYSFGTQSNPNELIVECDVFEEGIRNVVIVQPLNFELETQVFDVIMKTRKRWSPLVHEGKVLDTRIRLRFLFTYNEL